LVALLGMGGIGKTALAARVAQALSQDFDYLVWRSLRNAPPLEALLTELVPFLSNQQDSVCSVARLMHWLRQSRCLVVLDNCETILKGGERAGQFRQGYENYEDLIRTIGQGNHQSCLLLTSREKPAEISAIEGLDPAVRTLQIGGSPEGALAVLETRQLTGSQAEKEKLCDRYGYSPLALQIVGGSIRDVFSGNIALFLEENPPLFNGAKKLLDSQFARLIPLEKTVMYWLAINRDWTSIAGLMADIYPKCIKRKLLEALESLCWRSLVEQRGNLYSQQPVIMEYVTDCLTEQLGDELLSPKTFAAETYASSMVRRYALIKTTVKDFIRHSQERLILQPVAERLHQAHRSPRPYLKNHLQKLKAVGAPKIGYGAGNLINLGCALNVDFTGLDLSNLAIWQAHLVDAKLHWVNWANTQFRSTRFSQPLAPIFHLAYSPDGSRLAAVDGSGLITVFEAQGYSPALTIKASENWAMGLGFSPDGRYLIGEGMAHGVNVWDSATGELIHALAGHSGLLAALTFSPQENVFLSAGADDFIL
ncbi:MAG: NACHT domain-containing protein, partial [Cyanobacteria bacterium P01_A01_bin.135]